MSHWAVLSKMSSWCGGVWWSNCQVGEVASLFAEPLWDDLLDENTVHSNRVKWVIVLLRRPRSTPSIEIPTVFVWDILPSEGEGEKMSKYDDLFRACSVVRCLARWLSFRSLLHPKPWYQNSSIFHKNERIGLWWASSSKKKENDEEYGSLVSSIIIASEKDQSVLFIANFGTRS